MDGTEKLLSVRDLTVKYTSGGDVIHAVNGVSFDLEKGKSLGLVGETGAGKTTIAKAIMRILPPGPSRITGGEIMLDGQDILKLPEKKMLDIRGKRISMIFQDPMTALNPTMTIGGQIAEVVRLHSDVSIQEAKQETLDVLRQVGIMGDRYNNYPYQFSGGMKQRVVIAMALVFRPDLLLADEPTTALDVTIQAQILETIRGFKKKFRSSMVLVTHDLGIVAENCDSVAVIYAGQVMEYGSLEDIFDRPSHPYTVGLFHSLPSWASGEERLHPILGSPPDPRVLPKGCAFAPRCPRATKVCFSDAVPNTELSPGHLCRCLFPEVV